jgi:hypothetical protein
MVTMKLGSKPDIFVLEGLTWLIISIPSFNSECVLVRRQCPFVHLDLSRSSLSVRFINKTTTHIHGSSASTFRSFSREN